MENFLYVYRIHKSISFAYFTTNFYTFINPLTVAFTHPLPRPAFIR